jgi:hypothetical protein
MFQTFCMANLMTPRSVVATNRKKIEPRTVMSQLFSRDLKFQTMDSIVAAVSDPIVPPRARNTWLLMRSDLKYRLDRYSSSSIIGEMENVAKNAVEEERIKGSLRFNKAKPLFIALRIVLIPPCIFKFVMSFDHKKK